MRWVVLATCLYVSATASAQSTGADVVHLVDGGIVRGTIVEHLPGDHTTILLVTGETRTFPSDRVASVELGSVASSDESPGAEVGVRSGDTAARLGSPRRRAVLVDDEDGTETSSTVHVQVRTASRYRLELHRLEGSASGTFTSSRGSGTMHTDFYSPLCEVPCELELDPGFHAFGVARAGEGARRPDHERFTIDDDTALTIHFRSHSALRAGGWIMLVAGLPTSALLLTWGVFLGWVGVGLLVPGGILALFSIVHFFVNAFRNDHLDVTAEPLVRF